ncbi:neurocalcin homolog [Branchiostoma floridae x Branchiostoma belcheri]|nr:Visinin-like protein 1 [Branchiostoma belcheri]
MGGMLSKLQDQIDMRTNDGRRRREKRHLVEHLTRITNFRESEVKKWYRLFFTDCPDGILTEEKFVHFYVAYFSSGDRGRKTAMAKRIFRAFDRDGSGTVDFKEYLTGMSALLRGSVVEKLKWAFNMYDLDGNGEISRVELYNVLKLVIELRSPEATCQDLDDLEPALEEMVDRIFQDLDKDRDGKLQMREFVEGIRRNPNLLTLQQDEMPRGTTVAIQHLHCPPGNMGLSSESSDSE